MPAFRVTLPSGERYWTVVDDDYRVVGDVDVYLRDLRFGQDCAESTTKAYAESLALYLRWCERSERDWRTGAERMGAFVTWLKHTPSDPEAVSVGPGLPAVRGPGRINRSWRRYVDSCGIVSWSVMRRRRCWRRCSRSATIDICRSRLAVRTLG